MGIKIEIKDNAIGRPIDDSYNLKVIQTRKEYVNTTKWFWPSSDSRDKLIGEPKILKWFSFAESWLL